MIKRVLLAVALTVAVAGVIALTRGDADRDAEAVASKGKPPVVLLMFDEFPADLLLGRDGRIDAGRYPAFAELARTGYWFPNATTTYDSTTKAIPQIIDGKLPRAGTKPTFRGHPRSVYDLFAHRGYEIERVEAATSICPPRHCPGARARRPAILPQLQHGRREGLERFLGSIGRREQPTFWLGHILLPHGPYLFLPSGKQMRAGWQDLVPGVNGPPSFGSRYLALHAQQRLQLQIGFLDRQLGRLFRRMKREGTFDRALIVVTADHGISSESGVDSRRATNLSNIDELAPVPLFVKAPRQRRGRAPRSYVRTTDVVPTIADVLGWRLPYRADGRSAFSRLVRERRSVMVIERDFSGRLHVPAAEMERRRAALLRLRLRRFGSGSWDRLYTGIGAHRSLLGKPVSAPAVAARGPQARIAGLPAFRRVASGGRVLPTQIAGSIDSAPGDTTRDIAIAANGTVVALGRTFHLQADALQSTPHGESFSVMIPESSIRPGRNRIDVLEVMGDGRSLRPLGSSQ
jgi:Sulfatase